MCTSWSERAAYFTIPLLRQKSPDEPMLTDLLARNFKDAKMVRLSN